MDENTTVTILFSVFFVCIAWVIVTTINKQSYEETRTQKERQEGHRSPKRD